MKHYARFTKQLTKWLTKEEIEAFTKSSQRFNRRWDDVTFIVKSNQKKKNPLYAVFIRKENKLRRVDDIPKGINFSDLFLKALPYKQEGVSIFQTMKKYL